MSLSLWWSRDGRLGAGKDGPTDGIAMCLGGHISAIVCGAEYRVPGQISLVLDYIAHGTSEVSKSKVRTH